MLSVKLIAHTPVPEQVIAAAAKTCYSPRPISQIMDDLDDESAAGYVDMLSEMGHDSPIEHASFTFAIEGVSRSLLAQLTRHRIASYSVKSQRYVSEKQFTYVTPPEIAAIPEAEELYRKSMQRDQEDYDALVKILTRKHLAEKLAAGMEEKAAKSAARKQAQEDARYVLPNACDTQLIVTMNARSLKNFFAHRCCNRAQWEIRELARQMLILVRETAPALFAKAGPSCLYGPCPEGRMSCGKAVQMRKLYKAGE